MIITHITAVYGNKIDESYYGELIYKGSAITVGEGKCKENFEYVLNDEQRITITVCRDSFDDPMPEIGINQVMHDEQWVPKVGQGCHYGINGDSYPYTVRKVSASGKTIWVSRDDYKVMDDSVGLYEGPKRCWFEMLEVPEEEWECFKLKKDGCYRRAGTVRRWSPSLRLGREYAYNPHI